MIRLAIVDDNQGIRDNLKQIFGFFDEVELDWVLTDGEEAVGMIECGRIPDVILMDIEMRKMNGIDATREIKELNSEVKIIMLSVFRDEKNLKDAIAAGADGYLLKDEKPLKMLEMIKNAMEDRFPLSPEMARHTMKVIRSMENADKVSPETFRLTKRETEVLKHLVAGRTYKEIADALIVSPLTVRSHMENLYRKLEVHNKAEAIHLAMTNNWF